MPGKPHAGFRTPAARWRPQLAVPIHKTHSASLFLLTHRKAHVHAQHLLQGHALKRSHVAALVQLGQLTIAGSPVNACRKQRSNTYTGMRHGKTETSARS
jgi:hypothetical protein